MKSVTETFACRRVFVTGGNGFIGANLVRVLVLMGARVHLLLRPQTDTWRLQDLMKDIQVHSGDMADDRALADVFDAASPDFVFHLATPRGSDASAWVRLVEANVSAATGLVKQMQRAPSIRMVVTGSSLEYGPSSIPHREDDPLRPTTWHGTGKATASHIYRQAVDSFRLRITQLRLFHVYGPWEASHRLLPTAIRAALSGFPMSLTASNIRRDWVYVGDVVDALLVAAFSDKGCGIYNIGSGEEISNEEVVAVVERTAGKPIVRGAGTFPLSASDTGHRCADIDRARTELGWYPKHDFVSGVSDTLTWCCSNPSYWEEGLGDRPRHV